MPQLDHNLAKRLRELPESMTGIIRESVIFLAEISPATWFNFVNGKSGNVKVFQVLAQVLGCSIDDLLNKEFQFEKELVTIPELPGNSEAA